MSRRAVIAIGILGASLLGFLGFQNARLSRGEPLSPPPAGALRVATLNVHYLNLLADNGPWSRVGWERRRAALGAAVKALSADVIAFQEMESFAGGSISRDNLVLDYLVDANPLLSAAAVGDPIVFPSTQPIFYRADRLTVRDEGWFFFSQTPDVAYSRGFDGAWPSFASWARFAERDGRAFTVINVHFDYSSWENRRQSAQLVAAFAAQRIAQGETVIVAGDLNALHGSRTMAILEAGGLTFGDVPGATFHFNRGFSLFGAIDHIGHGPGATPLGLPRVLRQRFGDVWPSDHYPVVADFSLR